MRTIRIKTVFVVALGLAAACCANNALAAVYDFNGSLGTAWETADNWTPAGPPTGAVGDTTNIGAGLTAEVSQDGAVSRQFRVGVDSGAGTLLISGGSLTVSYSSDLGGGASASTGGNVAHIVQTAGIFNSSVAGNTYIGRQYHTDGAAYDGLYEMQGGTFNVGYSCILGYTAGVVGVVNQTAGTVNIASPTAASGILYIGHNGVGTYTLSDGLLTLQKDRINLATFATGNGTFNLKGGTLDMYGHAINKGAGTYAFNFTGGTLQNAGSINFALTQNNTDSASILTPGTSTGNVGTMTIAGDYAQLGGTYLTDLAGLASHDLIEATGTAVLNDSVTVNLSGGFMPQVGDYFDVLTAAGGVALGSGFTVYDPAGGPHFTASVIGGNVLRLTVDAVPEPSAVALLTIAMAGLIAYAWRKRR